MLNNNPQQSLRWNKHDTTWMLSLYGTAIGAGVLFLPINAGLYGIWPVVIMIALAFPMTYFSHRAFCRLVLSGSANNNITQVVEEHFGKYAGKSLILLYFIAIYPLLLIYSVAITNTTQSFITNQLGMTAPPRALLALFLMLGLTVIIRFGQQAIVKFMSILVYPFILTLLMLALYLTQYWNGAIFHTPVSSNHNSSFLLVLWLIIPVMVYSFNHSPIISSFAVNQKERYGESAEKKSSQILKYCHIIMVATVMFFVCSCILSLSPQDLAEAKEQNITILSYLANHFHTPILAIIAPLIAFVAISKSYLGHYLGAREGLHGVITQLFQSKNKNIQTNARIIELFIFITCWLVAVINPSILGMIEIVCGPIIAMLLFLMPMYAIVKVPALQPYRQLVFSNLFIIIMGLIALSAIVYKLFY